MAATYYTVDGGDEAGTAFTVAGDGTHSITFWSVDGAGNIATAGSDTVRIDTTAHDHNGSYCGNAGQ